MTLQRVNGRIAMWGFAAGVAAELSSHESIVEQATSNPIGICFFMLLLSIGSIMPKFASGVPIGALHMTCGLRKLLQNVELECILALGARARLVI